MSNPSLLDDSKRHRSPIKDLVLKVNGPIKSGPVHGSGLHLVALRGRLIVLFVLGIDCSSCRFVAGVISKLRSSYHAQVEFIGVCVQTGCREKLADFSKIADVKFPLTFCLTRDLCSALGIPAATWLFYPTLIFVDQEQQLRAVFVGGHDFFKDAATNICAVLDELLAQSTQAEANSEVRV